MAEKDFKYTLTFDSRATGKGATDAAAGVEKVANSQKRLTQTQDSYTAGATRLAPVTRNNSQALLLFSQGLEDSQFGIRGVLNNIPGLIIALGGTAGLAGAISIAAVSLSVLQGWFTKTTEKAKAFKVDINDIASSMGEIEADRLEDVFGALDAASDAARELRQNFEETAKAEADFSTAALDNAGKLQEAQRNIAAALGLQVNSYQELQAIAAQEEAKRADTAARAIELENQRLAKAKEAATERADYLANLQNASNLEQAALVNARAELDALRAKKKQLEEILKLPTSRLGAGFAAVEIPENAKAVKDAKTQLASPAFQAELLGQEKRIAELENKITELTKPVVGSLSKAEVGLAAANNQVLDLERAVSTNLQRIQDTLATDNLLAQSELIKTLANQQTEKTRELTDTLTGQAEAAKQTLEQALIQEGSKAAEAAKNSAVATLTQLLADGSISPEEIDRMRNAMEQGRLAMLTLNTDTAKALGQMVTNTDSLRTLMHSFLDISQRQAGEIQTLRANISTLSGRIK